MRFISSLCWVKKGASSTPSKISLGKDELGKLFQKTPVAEEEEGSEAEEVEDGEEESNDQIDKKYRLDEYDDDGKYQNQFWPLVILNLNNSVFFQRMI